MMSSELISRQYDKMTKTPIAGLLVSLSIPTVITMLISNLYNLVDTAFVGLLGTSASGAVGIVFGYMSILQAVGFFFGQGSGSIMSRELGAKRVRDASETASKGIVLSFVTATVVAIVCAFNIDWLVRVLGSTDTIAPYSKTYVIYILASAPFIVSSFTMNNILRYEGRAKLGAIAMLTGAVLNIALDPLFMFALDMGVAGAGLSTAISQVVSFSILLSMFLRKKTQTTLSLKNVKGDIKKIWNIAGTGFPSMLRQCLNSLSVVVLNYVSKPYGDAAIAGMSIVSRIVFFVFSIAIGFGQGFQPISSFNYGAQKYGRVRKAYRITFIISEILVCIISVIAFILAPQLVKLFRNDADVILIGVRALRLQLAALLFLPYCMVSEMLLQTTGQKLASSFLSASRSGILFIPALYILSNIRGLAGIQEAQPIAFILSCIPSAIVTCLFFKKIPKTDVG